MKTKNLFLLVTLFAALSVSAQDSAVVINGVRWASRNVDVPGTFAKKPEDAGMFYQWNSKVGWPAIGAIGSITASDGTTTWNSKWNGGYTSPSTTDIWTLSNDPSPVGWRVPNKSEIAALLDTTKVTYLFIKQHGVNGGFFIDKTTGNSIFLPAFGFRNAGGEKVGGLGYNGFYWCSVIFGSTKAYSLYFFSCYADWNLAYFPNSLPIRPVAK